MRSLWTAVFIFGITVSAQSQTEPLKALEGTWLPVEAELGGEKFPNEILQVTKLVIKDNGYIAYVGKTADEGTIKVDATQKPATIDIIGVKGPNMGKTMLAIYERSGDTLRVCYDLAGKQRPSEFRTRKGTQQYYVVYKKQ